MCIFIEESVSKCHSMRGTHFSEGMFDLHIKTGPGSFKTVSKKDGNMQETTVTCCDVDKMKIVMKDLKTGKSLNCMTEKFCDFSGKYKIVSTSGMADFCKALGMVLHMPSKRNTTNCAPYSN